MLNLVLLRFPALGASGQVIIDEQKAYANPVGFVRHEVYNSGEKIVNVTVPNDHILHPGIVIRWVSENNLNVTIHTYGEGAGDYPRINEVLSGPLWRGVGKNIFNYMVKTNEK